MVITEISKPVEFILIYGIKIEESSLTSKHLFKYLLQEHGYYHSNVITVMCLHTNSDIKLDNWCNIYRIWRIRLLGCGAA
jgi:hypothetical protein